MEQKLGPKTNVFGFRFAKTQTSLNPITPLLRIEEGVAHIKRQLGMEGGREGHIDYYKMDEMA